MSNQPIITNATGATQPDQKLHLKDGELFTTFHDRPEQSFGTVTEHAQKIVDGLTPSELAYATSPERGQYFGFAALHDLFDANMLLPGAEDADPVNHFLLNGTEEENGLVTDFANMITEQVNVILRGTVAAAPATKATHSRRVVTWMSPGGSKFDLCSKCEAAGVQMPRDTDGQEYCTASFGLHEGDCDMESTEP